MKRTILLLFATALYLVGASAREPELVMQPGTTITATTTTGTIAVSAGVDLKRAYTWESASRSAVLIARPKRWHGSLGAYFPGPGDHWREHHGITRGVLEEGQQHFLFRSQALAWLRKQASFTRPFTATTAWWYPSARRFHAAS